MILKSDQAKTLYDWTKQYILDNCIARGRFPGKIPGTSYTWMFYLRRGLFNPNFSSAIAQLFWHKISLEVGHYNFQLTGLETAATPMLAVFPLIGKMFDIEMNAFVVRKEQKTYGLENWIEGVPNDLPALIIDDLCNSSESMAICKSRVEKEGIKTFPIAFSIVNKVNQGVHSSDREKTDMYLKDTKVISLFTLDDFGLSKPSH